MGTIDGGPLRVNIKFDHVNKDCVFGAGNFVDSMQRRAEKV